MGRDEMVYWSRRSDPNKWEGLNVVVARDETLLTRSQELGHGSLRDAMAAMGNSPPLSTINMQRNILAMLMAVNQQLGWVEARLERVEGRMSEKAVWPPVTQQEAVEELVKIGTALPGPNVVITGVTAGDLNHSEGVPNYVGYPLCEKHEPQNGKNAMDDAKDVLAAHEKAKE